MLKREYPQEYFVPFDGDDFCEGRLTVNLIKEGHCVEVDLIQKESKKILRHLTTLYKCESEQEAMDQGMQELASFIRSVQHRPSSS